jgi:hypothetical protein
VAQQVNPTMTRDELIAAAESIGMRFPDPVVQPLTDGEISLLWARRFGGLVAPQKRLRNSYIPRDQFDIIVREIEAMSREGKL